MRRPLKIVISADEFPNHYSGNSKKQSPPIASSWNDSLAALWNPYQNSPIFYKMFSSARFWVLGLHMAVLSEVPMASIGMDREGTAACPTYPFLKIQW
jgi:hypothetical protein